MIVIIEQKSIESILATGTLIYVLMPLTVYSQADWASQEIACDLVLARNTL